MYKYLTHDVSIIEICQQERSKISHNYVKKAMYLFQFIH